MKNRPGILAFLKSVLATWSADKAPKMAAALAYYTAFAVPPLLLIAIAIAGLLFGQDAARGRIVEEIGGLVGRQGAETLQGILQQAWRPKTNIIAAAIGVLGLLFAASGVFGELQDSLNIIWRVKKKSGRGVLGTLKDRFLSFSMVLGLGFLLLVTLIISTGLDALSGVLADWIGTSLLIHAVSFAVSFGVVTFVFAMIFKFLPDARTSWRDVWLGAAVTSLLFTIGKSLMGLYLGRSTIGTTYGAAGSFVILMLWINYSSQIVFLGAEFTRMFAALSGRMPAPHRDAVPVGNPLRKRAVRRTPGRRIPHHASRRT